MVTLKNLDNGNVEVSILIPVVDKPLGSHYAGNGFNIKDLESYGFNVTMTFEEVRNFFGDFVVSYNKLLKEHGIPS